MKLKMLLMLAVFACAVLPARAELTADDVSSREYLFNHGHSYTAADVVELQKGAVNGDKVVLPIDKIYDGKSLGYKWVDKFFIYLDPARENGQFTREDSTFGPTVHDIP